ncbi:MAG: hypothetical protein ACOYOA_03875 [Saprospiraceae bacterium]
MKKLIFLLFFFSASLVTSAQMIVDDVDICKDPDVKFLEVWLENASLSSSFFINASFGQRVRSMNPDTRRVKDKKGNLEVFGIAEVFNILDANGFDFVTIQIIGSGSGSGMAVSSVNMNINTTYIFKRRN